MLQRKQVSRSAFTCAAPTAAPWQALQSSTLCLAGSETITKGDQLSFRPCSSEEDKTPLPSGPLPFDTGLSIWYSRGEDYHWLGEDAQLLPRTRRTELWMNSAGRSMR